MPVPPPRIQLTQISPDQFLDKIRINSGPNIRYVSPYGNDADDGLSWALSYFF
jgi:hypothetical protein